MKLTTFCASWLLDKIPHTTICREGGVKYLTRYYLLGCETYHRKGWWRKVPFNVFLHQFHSSDEHVPHNHPWNVSVSLLLRGAYAQFRGEEARVYHAGDLNVIKAADYHWLHLLTPTVWTLFFSFKRVQDWGFMVDGTYVPWEEYLANKPGSTTTGKRKK